MVVVVEGEVEGKSPVRIEWEVEIKLRECETKPSSSAFSPDEVGTTRGSRATALRFNILLVGTTLDLVRVQSCRLRIKGCWPKRSRAYHMRCSQKPT